MKRIFLGRPVHWAALIAGAAVLYAAGSVRLHITDFNLYTAVVMAVSVALILVVLATTRRDEQVTRDPIDPDPGA